MCSHVRLGVSDQRTVPNMNPEIRSLMPRDGALNEFRTVVLPRTTYLKLIELKKKLKTYFKGHLCV